MDILVSFEMISQALQTELSKLITGSVKSKIPKFPEFSLSILWLTWRETVFIIESPFWNDQNGVSEYFCFSTLRKDSFEISLFRIHFWSFVKKRLIALKWVSALKWKWKIVSEFWFRKKSTQKAFRVIDYQVCIVLSILILRNSCAKNILIKVRRIPFFYLNNQTEILRIR